MKDQHVSAEEMALELVAAVRLSIGTIASGRGTTSRSTLHLAT